MLIIICLGFVALIHTFLRYIVAEQRAERLLRRKNTFSLAPRQLVDVALPKTRHSQPPEWLRPRVRSLTDIEQQLHDNVVTTTHLTAEKNRQDQLREKLRQIRDILNKAPELQ